MKIIKLNLLNNKTCICITSRFYSNIVGDAFKFKKSKRATCRKFPQVASIRALLAMLDNQQKAFRPLSERGVRVPWRGGLEYL